jgi:3-deoxy-D-manno-octulosonate 8-phosphate phosphatase (KDO 8-P phosphatase)
MNAVARVPARAARAAPRSGRPITPQRRAAAVRLVILDVDGVLTDGRLYFGADGEALKVFDVRDGLGVRLLRDAGLGVAVLSSRRSPIVSRRAEELDIAPVLQGEHDKRAGLERLLAETGIAAQQCAYMGDDWPDLPVMASVGFAAAVADAAPEVRRAAHWVAPAAGGRGAVRALAEFVLRSQRSAAAARPAKAAKAGRAGKGAAAARIKADA